MKVGNYLYALKKFAYTCIPSCELFFYLCTLLSSFHSFSPLGILTYGPDPPVSGYLLSPPLQVELAKEEANLAHTMAGRAPRRSRDPPISFSHEVCFSLLKHISLSRHEDLARTCFLRLGTPVVQILDLPDRIETMRGWLRIVQAMDRQTAALAWARLAILLSIGAVFMVG